jgi:beta-glucosidase
MVTVTNSGTVESDEVAQMYVKDLDASVRVPNFELRGFKRIHLKAGESTQVSFMVTPRALSLINDEGRRILEPGKFRVFVGGAQPDALSARLLGREPLAADLEVTGSPLELPY